MFDDHFEDDQHDEELARELLGILNEDFPELPDELPDRTMRKIEAEMTSRDLLDLTTLVFLTSFCAPILDLFAAFFGNDAAGAGNDAAGAGNAAAGARASMTDSVSTSYFSKADRALSDDELLSERDSDDE